MKRAEILDSAKEIVNKDREEQYGSPEDNFATIAEFWTTYVKTKCVSLGTDVNISPAYVGDMMILLKMARIAGGSEKADNFIDIAGYSACAGELMSKKNE